MADELTQSELVLGVGSGVGLCITILLVVGLWVRHAKCGQRSEVMMMVTMMVMVMAMVMVMRLTTLLVGLLYFKFDTPSVASDLW